MKIAIISRNSLRIGSLRRSSSGFSTFHGEPANKTSRTGENRSKIEETGSESAESATSLPRVFVQDKARTQRERRVNMIYAFALFGAVRVCVRNEAKVCEGIRRGPKKYKRGEN